MNMVGMLKGTIGIAAALVFLTAGSFINTYEPFIPIGQSPGLSDTCTVQGVVTAARASEDDMIVSVSSSEGRILSYEIAETTPVWLQKRGEGPRTIGTSDIIAGMVIELKERHCCLKYRRDYGGADQPCMWWIKLEEAGK